MVTILIFYESKGMRINFIKEIFLKLDLFLNVFNGFLHNSTSIRMFWKIDDFSSYGFKEFFLLFLRAFLEYLLEDIVTKTIFHKWFVLFENKRKNKFFRVLFTSFKNILNGSWPVLISGPLADLRKITEELLFRSKSGIVIVIRDVDHLVPHVVLIL